MMLRFGLLVGHNKHCEGVTLGSGTYALARPCGSCACEMIRKNDNIKGYVVIATNVIGQLELLCVFSLMFLVPEVFGKSEDNIQLVEGRVIFSFSVVLYQTKMYMVI